MVNLADKLEFHLVETVHAAGVAVGLPLSSKCPDGTTASATHSCTYTYGEYVHAIYNFALQLGGTLTTLMIIYAGYIYMTSQGDNTKINTAKDIFMGTLLGFVLLLTLGLILDFLGLPTFNIS